MLDKKIKLKTKDYLVSQENFNLIFDKESDMLITEPQPKNLEKYYDPKNYISHSDDKNSFIEKVYQQVKKITLNKKVKLIDQYSLDEKSILDIGCGTGEFLAYAKNKNWNTVGVEVNQNARNKALNKKLIIYKSLEDLPNRQFNIISLWHVLEHLPNLNEKISLIKTKLDDNGTLIIAVPNYKSYDAKHYKELWAAYDTPRHLWHFSQDAIKILFEKHNFKVTKTLPMYFDSFYVSLLSEKYKNGKSNYLKAFYRGLMSNIKAKSNGEYSSLIYILKKK
ncbi:class I SAM-dependent methyltransferase [Maribacter stanieri]|uniref:class I SAM-dependent methyltransferase n=1 Tax=Maribacter stanieri TaxID=440514 RepID=UPI0030DCB2B3|tara:strand:- start:157 stop:993 length:837 start_codon:yes stop_codon:yes gene_type:complete